MAGLMTSPFINPADHKRSILNQSADANAVLGCINNNPALYVHYWKETNDNSTDS
jgi:hypothetical protein